MDNMFLQQFEKLFTTTLAAVKINAWIIAESGKCIISQIKTTNGFS